MKQVRTTFAKSHIQELIANSGVAMSQVEIQERCEGVCDRVTIYRVLDRLVEEGTLHKTVNLKGVVKYAMCTTCESGHKHNHNHAHFNCEVCNQITCLENVVPEFSIPKKYKVKEMNFTISGVCPACA